MRAVLFSPVSRETFEVSSKIKVESGMARGDQIMIHIACLIILVPVDIAYLIILIRVDIACLIMLVRICRGTDVATHASFSSNANVVEVSQTFPESIGAIRFMWADPARGISVARFAGNTIGMNVPRFIRRQSGR